MPTLSNKILPAHLLRLYTWEMLKANGVLSEVVINTQTIIPLVPIEDEPELRDSGKPYIIYGWTENEENNIYGIQRGNMAFRVIAADSNQLSSITSVLARGLNGEDETAKSVNYWTSQYNNKMLVGIRFTWVKTLLVESADPAMSEGGPVEGNIIVGYRYVSQQEVITYKPGLLLNGSDASWR